MSLRRVLFSAVMLIWGASDALGQDFYDINTINTIYITFQEENWSEILDDLYAAGDGERLEGTVIINSVQYNRVGIRYKGNSSYKVGRLKNPFNIKLDHIYGDQLLDGYGTIKLSNVFKDPSFLREALGYEIARKYMPASKANFANVYVNDELAGLYTSVQDVDELFLENHFGGGDNACFKGEMNAPVIPMTVWSYFDDDPGSYSGFYKLESDSGWDELIHFLDILNNSTENIKQTLNVDRHLWMLALDILMVNLDSPVSLAHNYYLYKDSAGRFNPIMWDLNQNFGSFKNLGLGVSLNFLEMQELDPFVKSDSARYPVISRIIPDQTYKKMYVAHTKTIIQENFLDNLYKNRAVEIQNIISPSVLTDPNKFYSYNDFLNNLENPVPEYLPNIIGITQLMDARVAYLLSLPEFTAVPPVVTNVTGWPQNISPGSTAWITAEIQNATAITLCYRTTSHGVFDKTPMYDDGQHNDSNAQDGIYGTSAIAGSSNFQYYIYAENNDAAAFAPGRAEYEYFSIAVSLEPGNLSINEFMADNDSTIEDPDDPGKFEDWIEIYNAGGTPADLSGMYLTDDMQDPAQWLIPDNIIVPAGGYLIIWADNDTEQGGTHANFKLGKDGEEIALFDSDGTTLIDNYVFEEQSADISQGRCPDGHSDWAFFRIPTPGASNGNCESPEIENVLRTPIQPTAADVVTITATITDDGVLDAMDLYYSVDKGAFISTTLVFHQNNEYVALLPAQADASLVEYYIYVRDNNGFEAVSPENAPDSTYHYIVGYTSPDLFINEFMADNDNVISDTLGEFDDWIEIYNPGLDAVDIEGMYLSDDKDNPVKWQVPGSLIIPANGYIIIWADSDEDQGVNHAGFKLSKSGEDICLYDSDGLGLIDSYSFKAQTTDIAMARCPDGSANWQNPQTPTPGASNPAASILDGDINGDFEINIDDAVAGLQIITGQIPDIFIHISADVNFDSQIGLEEILFILNDIVQ